MVAPRFTEDRRMTLGTVATTRFRTLGYAGAGLFTICPPAFAYEFYQIFYTTAFEENQLLGLFAALTLVGSFLSVPLMLVGRRTLYEAAPSLSR
jgi:hypothetical protein